MTVPTKTTQRRRGNQAGQSSDSQSRLHSELFSLERLEALGQELASTHKTITSRGAAKTLLAGVEKSGRVLESAYARLAADPNRKGPPTPGDEWLLDNYHIVEAQIREVRGDLPPGYYRQLPKLLDGPFMGYPRVFGVAWAFVAHTASRFDPAMLCRVVRAYQRVPPLRIGRLLAVARTLRVVPVENI